MVPAGAGLGLRAALHEVARLHHARVPGAPVFAGRALGALADLAGELRADQDRGGDLRGRGGLRDAAAGRAVAARPVAPEQLLGGLPGRDRADRDLHGRRGNARRRLHRGTADAGAGGGLGTADLVRAVGARRLGRIQGGPRSRPLQPVEADHPGGDGRDLGAGAGAEPDRVVLQRQLPVAGNAPLRADHRPLVLVYRSIHRAARAGGPERDRGPPGEHLRRDAQAAAGLHLHHPGDDRAGPGPYGGLRGAQPDGRRGRERDPRSRAGRLPAPRDEHPAGRGAGAGRLRGSWPR